MPYCLRPGTGRRPFTEGRQEFLQKETRHGWQAAGTKVGIREKTPNAQRQMPADEIARQAVAIQLGNWQAWLSVKTLTDYQGRPVRLTEERLAHIIERPEMRELEPQIVETVHHPRLVIESISDPSAQLNYRFYLGTQVGDKWLCVVVKYASEDAFVLTAYLTDKPKRGKQIWPIK